MSSSEVVTFNLGNRISGKFNGPDLCIPRLFPRQCIFRSTAKAPKPASLVLVSLVEDFPFGRCLHDGVVVSYSPQALWRTVEIILIHYRSAGWQARCSEFVV